jgi:hypothetical protein
MRRKSPLPESVDKLSIQVALIGIAPQGLAMTVFVLGMLVVYLAVLLLFLLRHKPPPVTA